jgi:hypothetical protein
MTREHLKEVCRYDECGEQTCSFLVENGGEVFCAKGTIMQRVIDQRREVGTMLAKGDNCEGCNGSIPVAKSA